MKKSFKKYENLGLPGGPNELKRFTNGFIISERGQWDYPGQPTAVPTPSGRITMKGVENNLLGIDNLGNSQYMTPGNEYQFEGDMVYEIPQAKRGGGKKPSKKYSRSLMAKNKLFDKNPLLKKPRSVKNKIFDPYSPYFQGGGDKKSKRKRWENVQPTHTPIDPRYLEKYPDFQPFIQNEPEVALIPRHKPSFLQTAERTVNDWLGNPMQKAARLARKRANKGEDPVDNFRHPMAGYYTAQKIGPFGANALGVLHELSTLTDGRDTRPFSNKLREAAEDIYNNNEGAMLSFLPESWAKSIIGWESDNNLLPDGISNPNGKNMYFKEDGGFMEVELDDEQIDQYRKGGYIVEDISVPSLTRKDDGGQVKGTEGLTDDFNQRLTQFILDARTQGIDLGVGSGYRSYEKQKMLWEQALKKYGSPEKARKWVAPPGGSFHNKGLAVDLNSGGQFLGKDKNSKATEWAHANAKKYGLHFRMGHEPWHIEPIEKGKSSSEKENEHDDVHDHSGEYGDEPKVTTPEEMDLILKNKELEFQQKQQELEERERKLHDDDYGNWEPTKQEAVDPRQIQLQAYTKLMSPSLQNINQMYNAGVKLQMQSGGFIVELDDDEIKNYQKGGYIVEELPYAQGGLEKKTTVPNWQSDVKTTTPGFYGPPANTTTVTEKEIVEQPLIKEEKPIIKSQVPVKQKEIVPVVKDNSVKILQRKLKNAGYDIGKSGPSGDGVDGIMGNRTKIALEAFNSGIPPNKIKIPDPKKPVKGGTKNYTVNTNLKDGYLPYLDRGEEICVKGKGCSANVSIKMSNLLSNFTDKSLWANDAWFNKSDILNKGGDLVYENKERDYSKMQKVPKDVWGKLQVGDYVQLNRKDTASSNKFAAQTKTGLQNEGIEHLGFVVGKDKDGTPLIWHGSETGKAYVQRIDEPLALHDENEISGTNNFIYQVASIVRSPHLKNKDLSGLQETAYYSPLDPNKKLISKKGATQMQRAATSAVNKTIGQFKSIGYKQDDVNYVAQILIGGIMSNETQGGDSLKRVPKEIAATVWKNYLGQGNFEGDEASVGYYQLKPHLNFTNKDGSINSLGKKLQKLGLSVDDIGSFDINAQTKAGTLLLLDAYSQLKKDKDFNPKTGLYKNKIPASYILAKSWQAGAGWYKKDKYKKYLNNFDVDYSNTALKNLKNIELVGQDKNARNEYIKHVLPKVTKIESKVYTFPGRKDAKYKKDNFGNWYINQGPKTGNKYVKISDPQGTRKQTLNAWQKKYSNSTYKDGGFVMELDNNEIKKYLDGGYTIEEID